LSVFDKFLLAPIAGTFGIVIGICKDTIAFGYLFGKIRV
jgi:hypothetical protein